MQRVIYSNFLTLMSETDFRTVRLVILCGLPGSGKSSLGEILRDQLGYKYLSSDVARVEILRLTKGKFAGTPEYLANKARVYEYLRERAGRELESRGKVVLDATHLNEQRGDNLEWCRQRGLSGEEVLVVYVDGGGKELVRRRFWGKPGMNADGRTWEEAWETAYDYFASQIGAGSVRVPENEEKGYPVIWVLNR